MRSSSNLPSDQTQGSSSDENPSPSIMGREVNEDRIRELEEKIEEGLGDTIQLKRTRNSLLNISTRVPPEILGQIFWWRIQQSFEEMLAWLMGAYEFLLVCHYWFEVASSTPGLWVRWGNTLRRRLIHSETTPVDLVLDGYCLSISFDGPLQKALQERAKCDTIRSIQFLNEGKFVLTSVLPTLTPDDGETRDTSIESITLQDVDASNFFARCHFPKLWYLHLSTGDQFSSWEHLALHTTALTTLVLTVGTVTPTATQLLSILASNPRLKNLALSRTAFSHDDRGCVTIPVPLRHLEEFYIDGHPHPVFWLLRRLDYPETMDKMSLTAACCTVDDVLEVLGPYVCDFIQRDGSFPDGLGIFVNHSPRPTSIRVMAIKDATSAKFTADLEESLPYHDVVQLCVKFIAQIPVEYVVYFGGGLSMDFLEETVPMLPNIQELHLFDTQLSDRFLQPDPEGPLARKELLPSLRRLHLENPIAEKEGWGPLLLYLFYRTSGGRPISLTITGRRQHICKDVVEEMEGLVNLLILGLTLDDNCPFGLCIKD